MTTAHYELLALCAVGLALWIGIAYAFWRAWTWQHNRKRRADYARRRNR